jgi:hypothetical protein
VTTQQKNDIVIRFCAGESVRDVAAWAGVRVESVERLVREAMTQLIQKAQAETIHG